MSQIQEIDLDRVGGGMLLPGQTQPYYPDQPYPFPPGPSPWPPTPGPDPSPIPGPGPEWF